MSIKSTVAILIVAVNFSYGQKLFLSIGPTYSWASYSFIEVSGIPGASIHVVYEKGLWKSLYWQPELGLIQKGTRFLYGGDPEKLILVYGNLNLPLKLFIATKKNLYFLAGPSISMGITGGYFIEDLNRKWWVKFGNFETNDSALRYFGLIDNRFDFGILSGIGFVVKGWNVDLRYTHGVRNLYSRENDNIIKNARNRSFQLSVGIPLKKKSKEQ